MNVYSQVEESSWAEILSRPTMDLSEIEPKVLDVLNSVKEKGDKALFQFTKRFDGVELNSFEVSKEEIETSIQAIDSELKNSIKAAKENIDRFHQSQKEDTVEIETMPGVKCWRKSVGIEKVGLYIPGGTAPLFSTVLMLAVPAKIAGCKEIVLCSPPDSNGKIHPAILYTANLVGVSKIFKLGGAQAVAAMAFGTESIPKVNKIFGPGNQYVTAAKQLINKWGTAIDMPAGPSEVLVVADGSANPGFVAADLLSQAEHGFDSQVVLVCFSEDFQKEVQSELDRQLALLPRANFASKSLENSVSIIARTIEEAQRIVNFYAPEHLIIAMDEAETFAEEIINAGSVFLGHYTPESVGDYASGTNHTLPTNGFAKAYSGVSLDSFVKKITYQKLSKEGLKNIGKVVETMATAEELIAHKEAVSIRLKSI